MNRAALVAFARRAIKQGSKSFAFASRLFDGETRQRVWLLYAWCRKCDDMADGQDLGGELAEMHDPAAELIIMKRLTQKALSGRTTGLPAFDCMTVVAAECGLTQAMCDDVIDGFALDAKGWRPKSEDDLYQYCFHVAGAVGVMMAAVMGVDKDDTETLERACDLGLAFQLANIARDVAEDARAGRCYIPSQWLAEMGIAADTQMAAENREKTTQLLTRLCDASQRYEASARVGAARLPFRSRWAVLAAAGIYGDIARKVQAAGAQALDQRIYSSKREKLAWVWRAFTAALKNQPENAPRDGLWSRPRQS